MSSALSQDAIHTVIVVDDGSTDDTAVRARQCDARGNRVLVERLHLSLGPAAARNIAIGISTAPWLAVLDADDFFLPGRIRALLSEADDCDLLRTAWCTFRKATVCQYQRLLLKGQNQLTLALKNSYLEMWHDEALPGKSLVTLSR